MMEMQWPVTDRHDAVKQKVGNWGMRMQTQWPATGNYDVVMLQTLKWATMQG